MRTTLSSTVVALALFGAVSGCEDSTSGGGDVVQDTSTTAPEDVRVIWLIDGGNSWQCADPDEARFGMLTAATDAWLTDDRVAVGGVGFSVEVATFPVSREATAASPRWPTGAAGPASDLEGGLATAADLLATDVASLPAEARATTRYAVVVVMDAPPEPQCNAGCEDSTDHCGDGIDNDGDGMTDAADADCDGADSKTDSLYGMCNTDAAIPDGSYVAFEGPCGAYNTPARLQAAVAALKSAGGDAHSVVVHTRLVTESPDQVTATCQSANATEVQTAASSLLADLAMTGGGSFATLAPTDTFDLEAADLFD